MAKKKKSKAPTDPDAPPPPPPQPVPKVEVDPKWKWPPFPAVPPGVEITPFAQFVPKGISLALTGDGDVEDGVEVDGDGIPTVALLVKHNTLFDGSKRKKKKKSPLDEITEEELRKMTWDKRWELGEELRTAKGLDPMEPIEERFIESMRLFHQSRRWDPPRQELWDQFRIFSGVITGVKKPQRGRKFQYPEDDERPGAEAPGPEDEMSDDDLMKIDKKPEPFEDTYENKKLDSEERRARNEEVYLELLSKAEEKPYFWMSETEKATKIYLSSYFRDRGLLWSEPNSRDAPILLRFYFEFVLRNKIFVEKDVNRAYEKALQVVKRAEIELPYTFRISRAFPEAWGRACSTLWGKRDRDPWAVFTNSQLDRAAEAVNDAALSVSDDSSDGLNQHELVEAKYDLGERMIKEDAVSVKSPPVYLEKIGVAEDGGGATIEELDEAEVLDENMPTADKLVQPEYASLANGINGGHSTQEDYGANDSQAVDGIQNQDELNRTNGTSADANGAVEPNANDVVGGEEYAGWGSDDVERQKPGWGGADDGFDEEVWGNYVTPSIFPFVGPSLLPCTHIPIRVEESTRILVDIIAADPNSPNLLTSTLGVLVLQPWPSPNDDIDSMVKTPQLITFKENEKTYSASLAARNASRKFDPSKDQIRVYVDPVVLTECRVGMGIGGLWVQVGRKVEESEEDKEKDDEGAGKKTYTKKKKSSKAASDEWWYMESFRHAIPGYWTANEAERDMTRIENNPEYLYEYSE